MTVQEVMEVQVAKKLETNPGLAKEINALVHFDISGAGGGKWTLDCTGETGTIKPGIEGTSKMTVYCGDADFVKIAEKTLNANMAAMSGKLKFKPMDMGLAMKLGKLLA